MSRTVRGSLGGDRERHQEDDHREESVRTSSGRKKRNVERKPTFLSFFKVKNIVTITQKNVRLYLTDI